MTARNLINEELAGAVIDPDYSAEDFVRDMATLTQTPAGQFVVEERATEFLQGAVLQAKAIYARIYKARCDR